MVIIGIFEHDATITKKIAMNMKHVLLARSGHGREPGWTQTIPNESEITIIF